jgi:hypothetical protein
MEIPVNTQWKAQGDMSDDKLSTTTTILAVYGALLASVMFGWNLFRDLGDRARLKLSANIRKLTVDTDGRFFAASPDLEVQPSTDQLYVLLTVVNVGRRPIQWEGWGGKYREPVNGKMGFTITGRALPRMLNERESHREFTELEADLRPANDNVKKLYMWDASGKEWKLSWWQLRKLREKARKFSNAKGD